MRRRSWFRPTRKMLLFAYPRLSREPITALTSAVGVAMPGPESE